MNPGEIIALAALGLNVLVALIGLTWGVSKIRDAVRAEIEQHREKIDNELAALTRGLDKSSSDLRDKIREVEIWSRDTFVRRDSFDKVIASIEANLRDNFAKIERRLEGMEKKIDSQVAAAK